MTTAKRRKRKVQRATTMRPEPVPASSATEKLATAHAAHKKEVATAAAHIRKHSRIRSNIVRQALAFSLGEWNAIHSREQKWHDWIKGASYTFEVFPRERYRIVADDSIDSEEEDCAAIQRDFAVVEDDVNQALEQEKKRLEK